MAPEEQRGDASETAPLLRPATGGDAGDADADAGQDNTSMPGAQIALLCFARLVEPVAFFSIFPYVNKMAQENGGLAEADVGFYSGLIESLFSLTQAAVMILWGRAADRYGRKPVLVFSLVGVTAATAVFGMAASLGAMIALRCLAGVFAGSIVTIRTMLAEHSTPATQARVFSWFAFTGNLGILVGPLLGGALADPAAQYGDLFARLPFFAAHPLRAVQLCRRPGRPRCHRDHGPLRHRDAAATAAPQPPRQARCCWC